MGGWHALADAMSAAFENSDGKHENCRIKLLYKAPLIY